MLVLVLLLGFNVKAQEPWKLVKQKDGIDVFTRKNPEIDFKEFRAVMQIQASIEDFLAVMYDVASLPDWGHNIIESRLLSRPDPSRQTYYAVADAPWPYKDRDAVYSNVISWDEITGTLIVSIELLDRTENSEGIYVRMDGKGFWQANKMADGKIEIIFQMQVDPGGAIKPWIANLFATDAPYYTMKGIRKALSNPKYKGNNYDWLNN